MDINQNTGTPAAAFDITAFEASDTAWLEIQNKKEDGPLLYSGKPVRVLVRSPGTREALNAQHKLEQATTLRTYAGMRGKQVKETVETKLEERAEKLGAVTVEFENFPINPRDVYMNPKMAWFTNQVSTFHNDWANF